MIFIHLDSHGAIQTSVSINPTSSYVFSTPITEARSELVFYKIKGENYKTRPNILYFVQGFSMSSVKPYIRVQTQLGEDYQGNLGFIFQYLAASNPLKQFYFQYLTICESFSSCLDSPEITDLEYDTFMYAWSGDPVIGNYAHPKSSMIINFALKKMT